MNDLSQKNKVWNLSLIEENDNSKLFELSFSNNLRHYIMAENPDDLRNLIKKYTMDKISFNNQTFDNPFEINLHNIFKISYYNIEDIFQKLTKYSDLLEIHTDYIQCKNCGDKFTDYRSILYHIHKNGCKITNATETFS